MDIYKPEPPTPRRGSTTSQSSHDKLSHDSRPHDSRPLYQLGRNIDVREWTIPRRSPWTERHALVRSISEQPQAMTEREVERTRRSQSMSETGSNQDRTDPPYRLDKCCIHTVTSHENKECWITGCAVLSPDRVVVVDSNNNRVKIIDIKESTTISRLVVSACPKDVAMVTEDTLVVTLPSLDTIQFLTIKKPRDTLDFNGSFKVKGYCCGIACLEDRLFVAYSLPPKVEILSLKGVVINSFTTDSLSHPLFKNPQYITVNRDVIFVSDCEANAVMKLSHDGDVEGRYTDPTLVNPKGVAISSEHCLLVASQGNHTVHLLNMDCKQKGVVLSKEDGLYWPLVLEVCPDTKTLYLSSTSGQSEYDNFLSMYTFEND